MNFETTLDLEEVMPGEDAAVPFPAVYEKNKAYRNRSVRDILASVCETPNHTEAFKANLEKLTFTFLEDGVLQFRLFVKDIERPLTISIATDVKRIKTLQKIFVDKTLRPGDFRYERAIENLTHFKFQEHYVHNNSRPSGRLVEEAVIVRKYSDLPGTPMTNILLAVLLGIITQDELKEYKVEIKNDGIYVNSVIHNYANPLPNEIKEKLMKNMSVLASTYQHFTHRTVVGPRGPLQTHSPLSILELYIQNDRKLLQLIIRKKAWDRRMHGALEAGYMDPENTMGGTSGAVGGAGVVGGGSASSTTRRGRRHRKTTRRHRHNRR